MSESVASQRQKETGEVEIFDVDALHTKYGVMMTIN